MPDPRSCTVSFRDPEGLEHEVEVTAASLFEAVASALVSFRSAKLADCAPGPMTELEVCVRAPAEVHRVQVKRFEQWLQSSAKTPAEQSLKVRLREILSRRPVTG